jgi:hypothetical protein
MAVWSTVGSVGVASSADQSKLLLFKSVVQLGPGTGVIVARPSEHVGVPVSSDPSGGPAFTRPGTFVSALIRYGVDVSRDALVTGVGGMRIRYRDGDGFVIAQLWSVDFHTGEESVLLGFDSRFNGTAKDSFQTKISLTKDGGPIVVSGVNVAFYIQLTLAVFHPVEVPVAFPPAVSAIELGVEAQSTP